MCCNVHCLAESFEAKASFADSGIDYRQEDTSACSSSQGVDEEVCKCSVLVQCCNNLVEAPVLSLEHASECNQMCLLVSLSSAQDAHQA